MAVPTIHANGADIPQLGLGTWPLAGAECARTVDAALRAGYRHIDTAAMYGNEEAVGEGLRASGVARDAIFLTTKVWYADLAPAALRKSAEASLARLGLDQVDLLLIHWPDRRLPAPETFTELARAKRDGLARHIGISNFTSAMVDEAVRLTPEPLVANQCEFHPYLDQRLVRAACARHGLAFVAYSPLGRASVLDEPVVKRIAAAHGATPAQILLAWHLAQGGVAIPKTGNPKRLAENLAAADVKLASADVLALSDLARPDGRIINPAWAPEWDS